MDYERLVYFKLNNIAPDSFEYALNIIKENPELLMGDRELPPIFVVLRPHLGLGHDVGNDYVTDLKISRVDELLKIAKMNNIDIRELLTKPQTTLKGRPLKYPLHLFGIIYQTYIQVYKDTKLIDWFMNILIFELNMFLGEIIQIFGPFNEINYPDEYFRNYVIEQLRELISEREEIKLMETRGLMNFTKVDNERMSSGLFGLLDSVVLQNVGEQLQTVREANPEQSMAVNRRYREEEGLADFADYLSKLSEPEQNKLVNEMLGGGKKKSKTKKKKR